MTDIVQSPKAKKRKIQTPSADMFAAVIDFTDLHTTPVNLLQDSLSFSKER